ncbi:MAG TPA: GTPase Era [Pseudomonadales bacterium]
MTTKCGYIAVMGRPNVGKSTLINRILGQKLNITSRKPQTTRHNLLGIKTTEDCQAIYVDTPGIHRQQKKALNRLMNRSAESVVHDVDVIVFVVDALSWQEEDAHALERVRRASCPVILVVNKVDKLGDKGELLPFLEQMSKQHDFSAIVPLSALKGSSVELLEQTIREHLPENEFFYDEEQLTDKSVRFLAAEMIREKIMRQIGHEIPYEVTVEIEQFKEDERIAHIDAVILVERDSQKAIIIGKQGQRLKQIGTDARSDIESLLQKKVMLRLWVKVKRGWSDDERALNSLGY